MTNFGDARQPQDSDGLRIAICPVNYSRANLLDVAAMVLGLGREGLELERRAKNGRKQYKTGKE